MEAIVNNLIKATGWSIFHSLWQGAIIYAILMLVVAAVPKMNAKVKHNLAYSAMCLMFMGFCITFFSIFNIPDQAELIQPGQVTSTEPVNYLLSLPQEINSQTEHIFPYLVSVYALGLLFQLLILGVGYKRMLKLKQAERTMVPQEWQAAFIALTSKLNLHRKISFYLSANVNVPLVIGYFKPVVLFPIALTTQLDMNQVEAILIHELSHIRRNDYLLNLIKTGIETVLFFNPFIWLSGRYINIEREHACDDLVLKFTGTPVTYAHALLKLEILKDKTTPALSMAATGSNQHLYQRIKRITDMKTNYMNAKQQLFAITLTVATVISLAWVSPAKTASDSKSSAPLKKGIDAGTQSIKFKVLDLAKEKAVSAANCKLNEDTTKKKKKFKIVTVDAKGEKKEYNSVKEMPDSLRQEVMNDTFLNSDDFHFDFRIDSSINASMAYLKSDDFKRHMKDAQIMAMTMSKKFQSPEWKKQQMEIRKQAMEMRKKFNSPEFKKQMKDVQLQSATMMKKFNSPEWKKQQNDIKKQAEEIRKKFDSPEFRKQIEEMKKLQDSPEYKELKEKFEKDIQKLKNEKGIKSDIKSFNIMPSDHIIVEPGEVAEDDIKVIKAD
ncbi:M56 family metallopeptidase [Pedobacter ginsengisoli]|uniref:M56 family metallopeptidase n=1 Tax=Pedobacter ginsengisoli TaxID=363852 RepID=UPI00254EBB3D|nr:M56 family metallopeptidase [Pedobacter ginsengisoli]